MMAQIFDCFGYHSDPQHHFVAAFEFVHLPMQWTLHLRDNYENSYPRWSYHSSLHYLLAHFQRLRVFVGLPAGLVADERTIVEALFEIPESFLYVRIKSFCYISSMSGIVLT